MNYATLQKVCADPLLFSSGVTRFLGQITSEVCRFCGQVDLRKFEVLNGCCERCRKAYLGSFDGWDDSRCRCKLPEGWSCHAGVHHDQHRRAVAHRFADGRTWLELCPDYRRWLRDQWGREESRKGDAKKVSFDPAEFDDDVGKKVREVEGTLRQTGFFDDEKGE